MLRGSKYTPKRLAKRRAEVADKKAKFGGTTKKRKEEPPLPTEYEPGSFSVPGKAWKRAHFPKNEDWE